MKLNTSHIAAVLAVSGVVLFGATTATAGGSPAIPDGSVWQSDIAKPVNDLYLLGRGSVVKTIEAQPIKIGQNRADRTLLSTFTLPPGTWLITTTATFNRTKTAPKGATKTRPQLALTHGGRSAGTIGGVDISPVEYHSLSGSAVQTITITKERPTSVLVYGHGANDDGSTFASGDITVAAQITATRIG
jgi:hypothetical protein